MACGTTRLQEYPALPRGCPSSARHKKRRIRQQGPLGQIWYKSQMALRIETEREVDGRWIAEVVDLPGVMVYAADRVSAITGARQLAMRVIEERKQHGESAPEPVFEE
jgi:predicted RNase H-like HicB family nuclease